jgi:two-component system, OmpR family, sensor histidine kinase VicK
LSNDIANSNNNNRIKIITGQENITNFMLQCYQRAKRKLDTCLDFVGPSVVSTDNRIMKGALEMIERGIKIRFITDMTKENLDYCKKLINVSEIRHIEGVKGNFGIMDEQEYVIHLIHQESQAPSQIIYSDDKTSAEAQQFLFNTLWNQAVTAQLRIRELEEGIIPVVIKAISDPIKIQEMYIELIQSAREEIMLIIPTVNGFVRQNNLGIINLLVEKGITILSDSAINLSKVTITKDRIKIRLLSSFNDPIENNNNDYNTTLLPQQIQFRNMKSSSKINSTILIIDSKESLVIEVKDDTKEKFYDAIGFAVYSNSRPTVLSYVSIFESFWVQSEIYEKLKRSENMEKQFISIASHELRNPIQPILGLVELLNSKVKDNDQKKILGVISRNAKKLKQLSDDILDISKIESDTLILNKEEFNLNYLISDILNDYNIQLLDQGIELMYNDDNSKNIFINADKQRLSQVVSNLLNNAIKFTTKGIIKIIIEKNEIEKKVYISVKDSGSGIETSIIPHLFSKFVTKSKGGTGLGLYLSKNIVEAHGGKIWAQNNEGEKKGATFSISLPLFAKYANWKK